jgi:serine/threonine-protein kinase
VRIATVGRYRILRPLDRRQDHRVFLAEDPEGDRPVVAEVVPLAESGGEEQRGETRRRFFDEARSIAVLEHPGLGRVRDFGEAAGVLWWVTEQVEGVPLAAYTAGESALPAEAAVELVAKAAEALAAAHSASVTHGAIRPSRLLRIGESGIKVVGFRPGDPGGDPLSRVGRRSVGYLSPEQVRGLPAGPPSDLFSLATVLFELLTGDLPFPGESESSTLYRIVHEEPRDAATAGRGVGGEIAAFLSRALAKDPRDRFPDADSFARELRAAAVASRVDEVIGSSPDRIARTPSPPLPRRAPRRTALAPFVLGAFVVLSLLAGGLWLFRGALLPSGPPPAVWLEAEVRTQPPDLEVRLDGEPLAEPGRVRFQSTEPFPLLTAEYACRVAEHRLDPADAGQVVVLVADPVELEWSIDPGVAGASVLLNGETVGATPLQVVLDLCRENRLELQAEGYRPVTIDIAAAATPLEARKLLYDVALVEIPRGRLVLPESDIDLVFYVDGRRLKSSDRELVLEEGQHDLRYKNEYHWVDRTTKIAIRAGETETPKLDGLALTTLVVQAFPANCKVYARQRGGKWRYIDETPVRRKVAPGRYEVKIVLNPTGEEQIREVVLSPGDNPPLRVAFGNRG